jgi:predicted hydrocarbon binding protein
MNRKEFISRAMVLGACGCGGTTALAQSPGAQTAEVQELGRKIGFMQKRMARLVTALDADTRQKVLETMGRECAKEFGFLLERFKGKPEEFLEEARKQWMESAVYDKQAGTIRIVDRSKSCTCAFVQPGVTPPAFCACSLGWQKEAYSTIFGEPVDVELESSVLRGAGQCSFTVKRSTRG